MLDSKCIYLSSLWALGFVFALWTQSYYVPVLDYQVEPTFSPLHTAFTSIDHTELLQAVHAPIESLVDGIVQIEVSTGDGEQMHYVEIPIFTDARLKTRNADYILIETNPESYSHIQLLRRANQTVKFRVVRASSTTSAMRETHQLYFETLCEHLPTNNSRDNDGQVVISPDGLWIAYSMNEDNGRASIVTESLETGEIQIVDAWRGSLATQPSWSPDSSHLVYAQQGLSQPVQGNIIVNNIDGTNRMVVSHYAGYYDHFEWSPDGRFIAFANGGVVGSGSSGYVNIPYTINIVEAQANAEGMTLIEGCFPSWIEQKPQSITFDVSIENLAQCEIYWNGDSIHSVIHVFETPHYDFLNSIGGVSVSLACGDNCSPLSVPIKQAMVTPHTICEFDRSTCGVWFQVDWMPYRQSNTIVAWISGQDDDIALRGNCRNLPVSNAHEVFSNMNDRTINNLLLRDTYNVIRQAGINRDNTYLVTLCSLPPAGHNLTAPELLEIWNLNTNQREQVIEVGRSSAISHDFRFVFSTNYMVNGILQPAQLIDLSTGEVITEAPNNRHVYNFEMTANASGILIAFHEFGYSADDIWLWKDDYGWYDIPYE